MKLKRIKKQKNNIESIWLQINRARFKNIKHVANEHVRLITTLYHEQLVSNTKSIRDFYHLTKLDLLRELEVKTYLIKLENDRVVAQYKKKQQDQERAAIELLKSRAT